MHQLPPKPVYLRVTTTLQRLGAVAIKSTVYALPQSEQSQEDFHWLREIVKSGGDT